jgi:hypothetical protein
MRSSEAVIDPGVSAELIPKVLGHHQTMNATIHDSYTYSSERWSQNIGAVSLATHQTGMCNLYGWRQRQIFSGSDKANVSFADAIKWISILRRYMREISAPKHIG